MTSKTIYRPISDRTLANFKPTRLYIKRHVITGIMYFGKSTAVDDSIYRYTGSGIDWGLHLKEFGKEHVETLWVSKVYTKDMIYELRDFALDYSSEHNVLLNFFIQSIF